VEKLKNAGFRSIQLVWEFDNIFAHCHRSSTGGITDIGYDVLQYLDQNKMIIDTANMNYQSMIETYQFTKKPIINSHTNVKALLNHSRNVTDDFLDLVARSDGVI
jgi:membrane dipeptidase